MSNAHTLSWEPKPFRELTQLAWPIAVSTLSYSFMTLVDTVVVGRLGTAELAGVGLGGTAAFTLLCFPFGLLRAAKTLVSQAVGAGQRHEARAYVAASVLAALVLGVATVGVGLVMAGFLPRMSATPAAGHAAAEYLAIRCLGAPMALVYVALREVRYGESDARTPMLATLTANLVNVVLCIVFVHVLHRGVAGAAWATVIAHAVEASVLVFVQQRHGFGLGEVARRHLSSLWRMGWPTAFQFSLEVGAFACLAAMISALSELEMAAHQIALQVAHFSFLPAYAVSEANSVLVGQAVGADRDDLVRRLARQAMLLVAAYMALCMMAMMGLAPLMVRGFTSDALVAPTAISLIHIAALFQLFDGANIVARGALRGTGDVRGPAVIGVVTAWIMTPPLTWLLGYRLGYGARGGWIGLCAEIMLCAVIMWWRLEKNGWKNAAIRSRADLAVHAERARLLDAERDIAAV